MYGKREKLTWFGIHLRLPKYDAATAGDIAPSVRHANRRVPYQDTDVLRASIEAAYVELLFGQVARSSLLQARGYLAAHSVLRHPYLRFPS